MPVPIFTKLGPNPQFGDLVNKVNTIVAELQNLMLNMDSINVTSLSAGTVIVYDLDGGPGTITLTKDGMVINNGTFDTFVVDINGAVTMTSATIKSATGYPRVEINPSDNLFEAATSADEFIIITPFDGGTGTPILQFFDGTVSESMLMNLNGPGNSFNMVATTNVHLSAQSNTLSLEGNNVNLDPDSALQINGTAGASGSFTTVDGKTVTVTKGIITSIV